MCHQDVCHRHQYIILFKGDDSDFTGNQSIFIELKTELDLTGCKAHFSFLNFRADFDNIPEDRRLELVFPATATALFPLVAADAELWIEDPNGKRRTADNRIHIAVTKSTREAYDNSDPQAISVIISGGGCEWGHVTGKPFNEIGRGLSVADGVLSINTPQIEDIAAFDLTDPTNAQKTSFLRLVKAYILAKEAPATAQAP